MANGVQRKKVLLLTQPRTASHLLEKMLSNQPSMTLLSHPFLSARDLGGKDGHQRLVQDLATGTVTKEQRNAVIKKCQDCFEAMIEEIHQIEAKGKTPFVHEHPLFLLDPGLVNEYYRETSDNHTPHFDPPYSPDWTLRYPGEPTPHPRTSPLIVPDDFLTAPHTRVIMPIRHPALVHASAYRAVAGVMHMQLGDPALKGMMDGRWQRRTYEWLAANAAPGCAPILIDADDVMSEDRRVMDRLCEEVGLDPAAVLYEWEQPTARELAALPADVVWVSKTLFTSSGVRKDKSLGNFVMEDEVEKWEEEFGGEVARWLKSHVEEQMGDYLFLRARRLTAD